MIKHLAHLDGKVLMLIAEPGLFMVLLMVIPLFMPKESNKNKRILAIIKNK
jgi:hypothetical protein